MKKIAVKIKGFIAYDLRILEKRFYWKTKKYLKKYYKNDSIIPKIENKTLIYMLDGRAYSGGISDILKGILSMYKFSKDLGFDFKINFCYPYNLQDYLKPNLYNWYITDSEISYNSKYAVPLWIYSSYNNYGKSLEFEVEYQKKLLRRFINKNATKQQYHIYTNSEWAQGSEYSTLFNELFKPAKPLLDALNYHKKNLGAEYISMTFRFQQLLGDFENKESKKDITNDILTLLNKSLELNGGKLPDYGELQLRVILGDFKNKKISVPLNEIDKKQLISTCLNKIIEIRTNFFPDMNILVTADSETFLNEVSKLDFVYEITNKNITIDGNVNEKSDPFLKAYIDILMLSEANTLLLLCSGPMYRSGFAKNASFINNKEYKEILF